MKTTLHGIRFYEEFTDQSKRRASGTVVAALTLNGTYGSSGKLCFEAVAGLFDQPNSPVAGTGVALNYLHQRCRRISETKARTIHPALFERLGQLRNNTRR